MAVEFDFPDPCCCAYPLFQEAMDAAGIEACLPVADALAVDDPGEIRTQRLSSTGTDTAAENRR